MGKKFIWYGINKHFNAVGHSHAMTTTDLLEGKYPSWMALKNRVEDGNCKFLAECFFTGLKDKNGKEIYEGDILKSKVELEGGTESIRKVVYGEGGFDMEKIEKDGKVDSMYLKKYWKHSLQVIGNIYENPELLSTPTAVL